MGEAPGAVEIPRSSSPVEATLSISSASSSRFSDSRMVWGLGWSVGGWVRLVRLAVGLVFGWVGLKMFVARTAGAEREREEGREAAPPHFDSTSKTSTVWWLARARPLSEMMMGGGMSRWMQTSCGGGGGWGWDGVVRSLLVNW